jgi:hypothetical protein
VRFARLGGLQNILQQVILITPPTRCDGTVHFHRIKSKAHRTKRSKVLGGTSPLINRCEPAIPAYLELVPVNKLALRGSCATARTGPPRSREYAGVVVESAWRPQLQILVARAPAGNGGGFMPPRDGLQGVGNSLGWGLVSGRETVPNRSARGLRSSQRKARAHNFTRWRVDLPGRKRVNNFGQLAHRSRGHQSPLALRDRGQKPSRWRGQSSRLFRTWSSVSSAMCRISCRRRACFSSSVVGRSACGSRCS